MGGWVGYARVYARVLMHPCFERYICVCGVYICRISRAGGDGERM